MFVINDVFIRSFLLQECNQEGGGGGGGERSRSPLATEESVEDGSPMTEQAHAYYRPQRRNGVSNESIKDDDATAYVKKVRYVCASVCADS